MLSSHHVFSVLMVSLQLYLQFRMVIFGTKQLNMANRQNQQATDNAIIHMTNRTQKKSIQWRVAHITQTGNVDSVLPLS